MIDLSRTLAPPSGRTLNRIISEPEALDFLNNFVAVIFFTGHVKSDSNLSLKINASCYNNKT